MSCYTLISLLLFLSPFSFGWSTTIAFHLYHHFEPIVAGPNGPSIPGSPTMISPAPMLIANGLCTQVPPGFCCRALTAQTYEVDFVSLPLGVIATVWQSQGIQTGCDGRVLEARYGLPRLNWRDAANPPRISGASFVQCPQAQGTGWFPALVGLCLRLNKRVATVEPAWGYPDIILLDGTSYTDGRRGDLLYKNAMGDLLNLTAIDRQE